MSMLDQAIWGSTMNCRNPLHGSFVCKWQQHICKTTQITTQMKCTSRTLASKGVSKGSVEMLRQLELSLQNIPLQLNPQGLGEINTDCSRICHSVNRRTIKGIGLAHCLSVNRRRIKGIRLAHQHPFAYWWALSRNPWFGKHRLLGGVAHISVLSHLFLHFITVSWFAISYHPSLQP